MMIGVCPHVILYRFPEGKRHRCPVPSIRRNVHVTVVKLDDPSHDRETESRAVTADGSIRIFLDEAGKYIRALPVVDTPPVVGNRNNQIILVLPNVYLDRAAGRSIFPGVVDQVDQNLTDPLRIGVSRREKRWKNVPDFLRTQR